MTGYLYFNRLETKKSFHVTKSRGDLDGTYDINGDWCNCCDWLDYQHAVKSTLAKHIPAII